MAESTSTLPMTVATLPTTETTTSTSAIRTPGDIPFTSVTDAIPPITNTTTTTIATSFSGYSIVTRTVTEPCTGCYGMAAVTQIVTAPNYNGGSFTRGKLSWDLANDLAIITTAITEAPSDSLVPTDSTINISNQIISQVSVYIVFARPTFVAFYLYTGRCTTTLVPEDTHSTAFSFLVQPDASQDLLPTDASAYISELPQMTCSTNKNGIVALVSASTTSTTLISTTPPTMMTTGISSTTKIAIVISISITGTAILIILVIFIQRYRARKLQTIRPMAELPANRSRRIRELFAGRFAWQTELPANRSRRIRELFAGGFAWQAELEANNRPQELPAGQQLPELE